MKIAVLGERDFATGFRLAGIKTVYEVSDADFVQRFEECFSVEGIGIIIMDEKYFKNCVFGALLSGTCNNLQI